MKKLYLALLSGVVAIVTLVTFLSASSGQPGNMVIKIAHTGSPHLAPLYTSLDRGKFEEKGITVMLKQFDSTTNAGYALLAGRVDAAFIEPAKSFRLINENEDAGIKIAGSMNYNFGATLVVREGLSIRLHDLEGLTVAAGSRRCMLLVQFKHDAQRLKVDTDKINFVYMDFDTMLPALEAGKIDAMLTRAAHALPAQEQGHSVLYQNWDVAPGDACCPEYLAQVEYFMLVRDLEGRYISLLDSVLTESSLLPSDVKRAAIARFTQFPPGLLQPGTPVAHYLGVSPELKQELRGWVWTGN